MIEYRSVQCPYCGAGFDLQIDCSAGTQTLVEDCRICCQPVLLQIEVETQGQLTALHVQREND